MEIDNNSKFARSILKTLCQNYFTGMVVDVEKNQYEVLHFSPWMEKYSKQGSFSEFVDEYVRDYVTGDFRKELQNALSISMLRKYLESMRGDNTECSYYMEYESLRYGELHWCKCKMTPMLDEENEKAQHVLVLFRDITEQKNAELKYEENLKSAK